VTLNQLLKEVYSLGFDEAEGISESFVFSVNRALKMIFTELVPSNLAKIKVGARDEKSFDIRTRVANVLFVTSLPMDSSGFAIKGAYVDGYTVTLPSGFTGDAFIRYKPSVKEVSVDSGEEEIDIPDYASYFLPLLTAFFVFLDDDSEKADYYMSLYRSEVGKLSRSHSLSLSNTYTDVTGWA